MELAHTSSTEVAARVARLRRFWARPDTLIRRQRAEPLVFPSPCALGADEFALRRGCRYGTRLVDLEQRRRIAVLEGRPAEPLTTWLQVHPTVAILVCDRADAHSRAGRQAAPDALQVADRFHPLRNAGNALKAVLHSQRWRPAAGVPVMTLELPASPAQYAKECAPSTPRKRAMWEAVQQRRGLRQPLRQTAPAVGLDRRTVRKYLTAERSPVYPPHRPRPTQLSPYRSDLAERWTEGAHHARRLHRMRVPMTRASHAHQSQEQVAASRNTTASRV